MRFILSFFIAVSFGVAVSAQENAAPNAPVNLYDSLGKKHGMWLLDTDSTKGDIPVNEFGTYDHGERSGKWYKMTVSGDLLSIENYQADVLDGEAQYFEKGKMYCSGNYRGLNPDHAFDTIMVIDAETQDERLVTVETFKGFVKHGIWRYYDPVTGKLLKEEEYQVDELISRKVPSEEVNTTRREQLPGKQPHYQPPAAKRVSYTEGAR